MPPEQFQTGSPLPLLAAVIIAKNEAAHIARTVQSVIEASKPYADCDIILVDSRSTDGTAEIAKGFPITVAVVNPGVFVTAALGRRIGQEMTKSKYVLFVDGDTEIDPPFVPQALGYLEANEKVAGVAGDLRSVHLRNGAVVGTDASYFHAAHYPEEVYQLGGNAVYRRSTLDDVGSFNTGMVSYEEAELAGRLRSAEYVVCRLPVCTGTHYTGAVGSHRELLRRMRGGLMIGHGQLLREAIRQGCLRDHLPELKRFVQFAGLMLLGVTAVIASLLTQTLGPILICAVLCAALLVGLAVRAKSLRRAVLLTLEWMYTIPSLIRGFIRGARSQPPLALRQFAAIISDSHDYSARIA